MTNISECANINNVRERNVRNGIATKIENLKKLKKTLDNLVELEYNK